MRILHIDEMFHPLLGYQINILPKFESMHGDEVFVFTLNNYYPRLANVYDNSNITLYDKQYEEKYHVKIKRFDICHSLFGRPIFPKECYEEIEKVNPDIVFCHGEGSISNINLVLNRKKINKPIILDSHMIELASTSKLHKPLSFIYRTFITPIIKKENIFIIKTMNDSYLQDIHNIPKSLTPYIGFGTDTELFKKNDEQKSLFRRNNAVDKDEMIFIYTGKLDEQKGGLFFSDAIYNEFKEIKKPIFLIISDFKSKYEVRVKNRILESKNRVIILPIQKYEDLANYYQCSDVMVIPKQCTLSFFDAQSVGLPVIAERIIENENRLKNNNGLIFECCDADSFRKCICKFLNMDEKDYSVLSNNSERFIKDRYDYNLLVDKYKQLYIATIENFNKK